jgi:hypothetical protein
MPCHTIPYHTMPCLALPSSSLGILYPPIPVHPFHPPF